MIHRNIGYIRRPHLIGPLNGHIPDQVGIDLVAGVAVGCARLWVDRLDAHQPHQTLNALAIDPDPLALQLPLDRSAAAGGILGVNLVDFTH